MRSKPRGGGYGPVARTVSDERSLHLLLDAAECRIGHVRIVL